MSLTEVKECIAELTVEERLDVAAFIAHLNRTDDMEFRAELDRRMDAMDSGFKISPTELEKIHKALETHISE